MFVLHMLDFRLGVVELGGQSLSKIAVVLYQSKMDAVFMKDGCFVEWLLSCARAICYHQLFFWLGGNVWAG
jgi:hypothetical protein